MKLSSWQRIGLLIGAVAAIAAVIIALKATTPDRVSSPEEGPRIGGDEGAVRGKPAPELAGLDWVNSPSLTLKELRGRVVLVDFWTYTCVNCIRTLPYLKAWQEKYAASGLTIIGVHAPEFAFERKLENVQDAGDRYGIEYPIALDNQRSTWDAFKNQYWPQKYLIDKNGVVRYIHIGEGGYEGTESWIKRLLGEAGASVEGIASVTDPRPPIGLYSALTPELYAGVRGYLSGHIGNTDEYTYRLEGEGKDRRLIQTAAEYTWPEKPGRNRIYVKGLWAAGEESLKHARSTEAFEDAILLKYGGASVNIVIQPEAAEPFDLLLKLDGKPLNEITRGKDVRIAADGQSYARIDGPRLYNLVNEPELNNHDLTIAVKSDAFAFYAFTFGVVPEP